MKILTALLLAGLLLAALTLAAHSLLFSGVIAAGAIFTLVKVDWGIPKPGTDEGPALDLEPRGGALPPPTGLLARVVRGLSDTVAIPLVYGLTEAGKLLSGDLTKAPHVLVGGATGSGKSVWLDTLIRTIAASRPADAVRLLFIDPKRVELARFASLPHTAGVATEKPEAADMLARLCNTMDERYERLQAQGLRSIDGTGDPRIVCVIDEFADLILPHDRTAAQRKQSETLRGYLSRLLALGRAAGIHMVLATQRPDARVVDGLMKANAPTRIAFRVASGLESRIVLDQKGAEALPGLGHALARTADGTILRFRGIMLEGS